MQSLFFGALLFASGATLTYRSVLGGALPRWLGDESLEDLFGPEDARKVELAFSLVIVLLGLTVLAGWIAPDA